MSCKSCGREPENGTATHWLGCPEAPGSSRASREADACEYGDCTNPKRPPGKGRAPKYCTEHSDPKTRK